MAFAQKSINWQYWISLWLGVIFPLNLKFKENFCFASIIKILIKKMMQKLFCEMEEFVALWFSWIKLQQNILCIKSELLFKCF